MGNDGKERKKNEKPLIKSAEMAAYVKGPVKIEDLPDLRKHVIVFVKLTLILMFHYFSFAKKVFSVL